VFRLTLLLLCCVLHSVEVRSLVREQCRVRKRPSSCGADSDEARDRGGWVRLISRRTEDISHHSLLSPFRGAGGLRIATYFHITARSLTLSPEDHPLPLPIQYSPLTPRWDGRLTGWQCPDIPYEPRRVPDQAHAAQITASFTIVPHTRLLRTSRNE
jgi:hypothetical protein